MGCSQRTFDSSVQAKTGRGPRPSNIQHMQNVQPPPPTEKTSDPALDAPVLADDGPSHRVEAFAVSHGIQLDIVRQGEHRREAVGEFQECRRSNDGHETEVVRNGCRDNIRDGPPDGHDNRP